ncbi:MAG TPA: HD domain-containing phosphohydrolase [Gaiellaceae bacterium]|nr:HD domain-containing phosphohydrolase [Gaiellaceae bacterium]
MSGDNWRPILEPLCRDVPYAARLDSALETVCRLTRLGAAYLYVLDEAGTHFHLERSRASAAPRLSEAVEGGAETIEAGPAFELPVTPEDDAPRLVATPAGRLYSYPLEGVGLLQAGPVSRSAPAHARRALADAAFPLALLVRQARQEEALRTRLASLSARVDAGQRLAGSALDSGKYVALLLELALRATRTEAGFVAIVGEHGTLEIRSQSGLPAGFAESVDLDPERGLFDWSLGGGGALILRDVETASRLGVRSLLAVPLLAGDDPLGVFALVNFGDGGTFDENSLPLLDTFSDQIREMLHNDRLFRDFAGRFLATVQGLARSLDVRRPHTNGHHERIAANASALAVALGHDGGAVEALRIAGSIHDAGMAGGSDYQADVDHPSVGAGLVEQLPLHAWVAPAVASHHEWWDGWGFPLGLAGEEIPRGGRILAAAEFIDEMSSGDPVREPWGKDKLVAELGVRSGTQLEPEVAEAAIGLIGQDGLVLGGGQ